MTASHSSLRVTNNQLLHDLLENLGIITLVALSFELVLRSTWTRSIKNVATGVVFAAGAVGSMATPSEVIPNVFFDMRHAFILLAAPLGGWMAVLIVAVISSLFRVWMSGPAAMVGLAGIAVSAVVAVVLPRYVAFSHTPYWRLGIYGLAASVSVISIFLLPWSAATKALSIAGLPFVIGNLLGVISAGHIVSYQLLRARAERDLVADSQTDSLTGVLNRRGFDEVAAKKFARSKETGRPLAVIIADVDHFKQINDKFGHAVGDQVLHSIGTIMTKVTRESDPVSRYGGEEFAIFLSDTDERAALEIGNRLANNVRHHCFASNGTQIPVTISVGIFVMDLGFTGTLRDALQQADSALYRAKKNGRDRVEAAFQAAA